MNAPLRVLAPRAEADARPVKVLHLVDSLGIGGAETWLIALLRHWRAVGEPIRMDFVATGGATSVFDAEAIMLGARIHYLRYGRRDLVSFASGFRRLLAEERYDVLHDQQDHASGWHYLLGDGRLPPVRVTHVHNPAYQLRENYGVSPARRLTGAMGRRLVARYATHIAGTSRAEITASGFDAPRFDHIPKDALHCGLAFERFRADPTARGSVRREFGWPDDARVVLFAGRCDVSPDIGHAQNHKNSGFAVQTAIDCALADERIRFVFAGAPSPATPVLRARIEAAGVGARIAFVGLREDIPRLMAGSDALFFPSRAEGLGMVAVESQAAGLPVLASTGVPAECVVIPELVRFLGLDAGPVVWREALLSIAAAPRFDASLANRRVAASPFAIAQSARRLAALYRTGVLA